MEELQKRVNVYQNIEESPIKYEYENFIFYFSSTFYQRNFSKRLESFLKEETYKLKNRYQIRNKNFINVLKEVLLISLYKRIEKRGFRIYLNEKRYKEDGQ